MEVTDHKARLALDLVEYEERLDPAMQQAFGKIFICDDKPTAKRISQQKDGFVCVTRQGDRYEPAGTLHGGSPSQGEDLRKVQEWLRADRHRREAGKAIFDLKESLKSMKEQEVKIQ